MSDTPKISMRGVHKAFGRKVVLNGVLSGQLERSGILAYVDDLIAADRDGLRPWLMRIHGIHLRIDEDPIRRGGRVGLLWRATGLERQYRCDRDQTALSEYWTHPTPPGLDVRRADGRGP